MVFFKIISSARCLFSSSASHSSDCCFYHFPFAYCCNYRRVYFIMFCSATSTSRFPSHPSIRRRWCLTLATHRTAFIALFRPRPWGEVCDALFKSRRVLYCFSFCILMSLFLRSYRFLLTFIATARWFSSAAKRYFVFFYGTDESC